MAGPFEDGENVTAAKLNEALASGGGGGGLSSVETQDPVSGDGTSGDPVTVADGSIDLDHLSASGTKNSTTFLRGDNTFATPPGGGSGDDAASWAEQGNTSRIPKNKLPADTAYDADIPTKGSATPVDVGTSGRAIGDGTGWAAGNHVHQLASGVTERLLPALPAAGSRDNKVPKFNGDSLGWELDAGGGSGGDDAATWAEQGNTDKIPADKIPDLSGTYGTIGLDRTGVLEWTGSDAGMVDELKLDDTNNFGVFFEGAKRYFIHADSVFLGKVARRNGTAIDHSSTTHTVEDYFDVMDWGTGGTTSDGSLSLVLVGTSPTLTGSAQNIAKEGGGNVTRADLRDPFLIDLTYTRSPNSDLRMSGTVRLADLDGTDAYRFQAQGAGGEYIALQFSAAGDTGILQASENGSGISAVVVKVYNFVAKGQKGDKGDTGDGEPATYVDSLSLAGNVLTVSREGSSSPSDQEITLPSGGGSQRSRQDTVDLMTGDTGGDINFSRDGSGNSSDLRGTIRNDAVDSAEIKDGAVDLAHLSASGTKDSTTFLRGDNTFAAPPSSGSQRSRQDTVDLMTGDSGGDINFTRDGSGNSSDLRGTLRNSKVTSAKIASNAVTNAKIANDAVDSAEIKDGAVDLAHLSASGTKDSTTFLRGDNTFAAPPSSGSQRSRQDTIDLMVGDSGGDINFSRDGSGSSSDLRGTLRNSKVTSAKIASNAVTNAKIANDAVDSAELKDGAVDLAHLSASGTKDSTTFLRGDNTFAAPSGGRGKLTWIKPNSTQDNITHNRPAETVWTNGTNSIALTALGNIPSPSEGDWAYYIIYAGPTKDQLHLYLYNDSKWVKVSILNVSPSRYSTDIWYDSSPPELDNAGFDFGSLEYEDTQRYPYAFASQQTTGTGTDSASILDGNFGDALEAGDLILLDADINWNEFIGDDPELQLWDSGDNLISENALDTSTAVIAHEGRRHYVFHVTRAPADATVKLRVLFNRIADGGQFSGTMFGYAVLRDSSISAVYAAMAAQEWLLPHLSDPSWKGVWHSGEFYFEEDIVQLNSNLYRCRNAGTSAQPSADTPHADWTLMTPSSRAPYQGAWSNTRDYNAGETVLHNGQFWITDAYSYQDTPGSASNWHQYGDDHYRGAWQPSTTYQIGDMVLGAGTWLFICQTANHRSGNGPEVDPTNWAQLSNFEGDWVTGRWYGVGSMVVDTDTSGMYIAVAIRGDSAARPSDDPTNWKRIDNIPLTSVPWNQVTGKPAFAPSNAEPNVQADWNETDTSSDAFIRNKPSAAGQRTFEEIARGLEGLSGNSKLNYNQLRNRVPTATQSRAGTMSAADKMKLDQLEHWTIEGNWDYDGHSYEVGDVAVYRGSAARCVRAHTSARGGVSPNNGTDAHGTVFWEPFIISRTYLDSAGFVSTYLESGPDSPNQNIGNPGMFWTGAWTAPSTAHGNEHRWQQVVKYSGHMYCCKQDHIATQAEPRTPGTSDGNDYWDLMI